MIAVNKNSVNPPQSLLSQECQDNLNEVIDTTNENHKKKISSRFYRADDVLRKLKHLYHCKCAYCESEEPNPVIEHYRPQKQITGIPRNTHKGYYWLVYEWTYENFPNYIKIYFKKRKSREDFITLYVKHRNQIIE